VHAHLGWVGGLGLGRGVAGVGVRRWPAAAAAAARGSGEERHIRQYVTWGGSMGPRGESGTVGRQRERAELQAHRRRRQWRAAARLAHRGGNGGV
jgi:hypothetical protein